MSFKTSLSPRPLRDAQKWRFSIFPFARRVCRVNLTGQTIALRFARPRGKGPSAAGPDFPANKLPSEAPSSQQASEEWRAGAANETFQNLGAPTQLSSNSPLHEGSAGSEAGLPSPLRNLLPEENFEWRIVAPDETVTLPQDDHVSLDVLRRKEATAICGVDFDL